MKNLTLSAALLFSLVCSTSSAAYADCPLNVEMQELKVQFNSALPAILKKKTNRTAVKAVLASQLNEALNSYEKNADRCSDAEIKAAEQVLSNAAEFVQKQDEQPELAA
jgi:hypothetical protein